MRIEQRFDRPIFVLRGIVTHLSSSARNLIQSAEVSLGAFDKRELPRGPLLAALVLALHAAALMVLIWALRVPPTPIQGQREILLTLQTTNPFAGHALPPPPTITSEILNIKPPTLPVADDMPGDSSAPSIAPGGGGITKPAESDGATHTTPPLSDAQLALARKAPLRLRLSITPDGAIDDATVEQSCGLAAVDDLVVAWVKAHWRYSPALRDGQPIAVETTALVAL